MFNRDVFYRQLDDVYERRDIDAIEKFLLDTLRALAEERAYNTPSCDLCITPADRISLNSGYLKNLLTVQNELLSLYRGVNRFDECLRISSVMKEEMTELGLLKTDQYAILLLNEGTAYRMMGRTGDALKDFDECDGILQNVRGVDPFTVASLYNNRAPVLLQQARTRDTKEAARSDYEKAIEGLRKALEIVRRIGNLHREEAVTLCGIAEICSLLGDDTAGESAADQAVALYKTAGTDPHEGAALRAQGDTQRPLFYLTISGILNVLLNLFFVIVLKMNVAGVALATISSQAVRTVPGSPVHCPLAKRDSRNCPDVPVQAYSQNGAVRTVPNVPL